MCPRARRRNVGALELVHEQGFECGGAPDRSKREANAVCRNPQHAVPRKSVRKPRLRMAWPISTAEDSKESKSISSPGPSSPEARRETPFRHPYAMLRRWDNPSGWPLVNGMVCSSLNLGNEAK